MLTLRQLRYFTAVARIRHFGRAADECSVSQPALSLQIQELEATLGGPLLERGRGGVRLTPLGEEIDRRARAILAEVTDLTDFARHAGRALSGPLRLGVIPSIAPYLLPLILPALRERHSALELSLREALTNVLRTELEDGAIDLALLALPLDHPRLQTMELFADPFLFLSPAGRDPAVLPDHPMHIDPDELLLLDEGHCMRDQALTYCRMTDSAARRQFGAASLATIVQMVANGMGSTLLPAIALPVELRGAPTVQVTRFASPEPERMIGLAWRSASPRAAEFRLLGETLKALHPALPDGGFALAPRPPSA